MDRPSTQLERKDNKSYSEYPAVNLTLEPGTLCVRKVFTIGHLMVVALTDPGI